MTQRSIDALTGLSEQIDGDDALVPSGTARLVFERGRGRRPPRVLAARAALHDLPAELVHLAGDLVAMATNLDDADRDALLHLILAVMLAQHDGSTRVLVGGAAGREKLAEVFATLAGPNVDHGLLLDRIERILDEDRATEIIGRDADAYTPLVLLDDHLYVQRLLFLERRFAETFRRRAQIAPLVSVQAALQDVAKTSRLSDEQRLAVERAASRTFTIVSGGPGTGKTSIVLALLRVLSRVGIASERIAIAAPTGKATNRLRESIEAGLAALAEDEADRALAEHPPKPTTLHRLLGYLPGSESFRHHENNPLAHEVVIVDEGSMIDLAMMERLLRALSPSARLVLLGDADQLPSVEAGAVLRDLVEADADHAVRLTKSYRMDADDPAGSAILRFAAGVNAGRVEDVVADGVRLIDARSPAARARFLERWYERFVRGDDRIRHAARRPYPYFAGAFREEDLEKLEAVFAHCAAAKLLCITRQDTYATGARAINEVLHRLAAFDFGAASSSELAVGEPILMLRNDYQRGLFNGDQGVVLSVGIDGEVVRPTAVFRTADGLVPFPLVQLEHRVERAYAMTVHKAQGSELDHVGLVLPEVDIPLLSQQIVYTAVTRAKRSVSIVGHPELLSRAVSRPMRRDSGLVERLSDPT